MLNADSTRTTNSLFLLLLTLLGLQILGPALNSRLWYDELDGRMLGHIGFGAYPEDEAPPIDRIHIDSQGHARVFSPGWIGLNLLGAKLDHGLWRSMHILAWVLALGLWSRQRLTGINRLWPVILAIAAPLVMTGAATTRAYNLGALGIVLALIANRSQRRGLWLSLSLTGLWLIHLVPFVMTLTLLAPSLIQRLKSSAERKQDCTLWVTLIMIAIGQYFWMSPDGLPQATVTTPLMTRTTIILRAFNVEGVSLLLILPALVNWKRAPNSSWYLFAAVILLPLALPFFRVAYLVFVLPIVFVEIVKSFEDWPKQRKTLVLTLAILTHALSFPVDAILPDVKPGQFTDPVAHVQSWYRATPLTALHEVRHRKWSGIDGEIATVQALKQPGDKILYEYSRLSVLARLWHKDDMKITGIFRDDPRSFPNRPSHPRASIYDKPSPLVTPTPPFWAFTPVDAVGTKERENLTVDEMQKWLSQWGDVMVFPVLERNETWLSNDNWPPKESGAFSDRVVFYVR